MLYSAFKFSMAVGAVAAAAGCATYSDEERAAWPAWFTERLAATDGEYPKLSEVPTSTAPQRSDAFWSEVESDLRAAGREVAMAARNTRADTSDDAAFEAEARARVGVAREAPAPDSPPPSPN